MHTSRIILPVLAVALVSCTQPAQKHQTLLSKPVARVAMKTSTQHVSIDVFTTNAGPHRFNLDTYALYPACVDKKFAKRMGFKKLGTVRNGDGSGKVVTLDTVLIPELRLGGVVFKDVPALVDDYSWVSSPEGEQIEGLLGYPLFNELLLELDYPNQEVLLRRGELAADAPDVLSHPTLRIRPDLPIRIGDLDIVAGLDSGARSGLMLAPEFIDQLELKAPPKKAGRAKTVYSEADILAAQLTLPLQLPGDALANVPVAFCEVFGKPLIGNDVLQRYSVTFDQVHGRVRFSKPTSDTTSSTPPEWYFAHLHYLTESGGRWLASNAKFESETEPFDAYGMHWEWGPGQQSVKGQMFGIQDGEEGATLWEFRTHWHPKENRAITMQFGAAGSYGIGTLQHEEEGRTRSEQKLSEPDGRSSRVGHRNVETSPSEFQTDAYDIDPDDTRRPRRSYTWTRQPSRKE